MACAEVVASLESLSLWLRSYSVSSVQSGLRKEEKSMVGWLSLLPRKAVVLLFRKLVLFVIRPRAMSSMLATGMRRGLGVFVSA